MNIGDKYTTTNYYNVEVKDNSFKRIVVCYELDASFNRIEDPSIGGGVTHRTCVLSKDKLNLKQC